MSQNNRGCKGKNAFSNDREVSDLPENIGNRKTFLDLRIPPDNVGNKVDHDPIATFKHDGLGNSLDDEPSHLKSGVLAHLLDKKDRYFSRKPMRDPQIERPRFDIKHDILKKEETSKDDLSSIGKADITNHGHDYMLKLVKEFAQLLTEKSGLPFSFYMKPINDSPIDEISERQSLVTIKLLIEEILKASSINALVSLSQYQSNRHRFGVFFVHPKERDPTKNKELISALRQVILLNVKKFLPGHVNVLLVLANAQVVIEGHLHKIGAKKIE
jgi:hypothetical protein